MSGCSGGGKSTLLAELVARGYRTVAEPGRRIVTEELKGSGASLPWADPEAFARRAVEMALADRAALEPDGDIFFDRGLIDAAAALEHSAGVPVERTLAGQARFHQQVFLVPPWPEIYETDPDRRHGYDAAVDEHDRLLAVYERLGYTAVLLPKTGVAARADFVLSRLA
ncbi:ATPase [Primorskyibacter flagellatus]|uniref:ATPase n=1 Tax=Primorskyibacter flagellatus TaxID=1387277 RepID=A0A917A5E5_9RHOB|nr:AAA family ATPase [Primorskyibacter flagellatus]GGE28693.1 ATPase [Primorskyibacter flagellatus]